VRDLEAIQRSLALVRQRLRYPQLVRRLRELENACLQPGTWSTARAAKQGALLLRERAELQRLVSEVDTLSAEVQACLTLCSEEGSATTDSGALFRDEIEALRLRSQRIEAMALLHGASTRSESADEPSDLHRSCLVEVRAGAGGTEAMDWCSMLVRMYQRWAESAAASRSLRFQEVKLTDSSPGEVAGLRYAALFVRSGTDGLAWATAWLRGEAGIHRLVRHSPFDASQRRHTSFASVSIIPLLDEEEVASEALQALNIHPDDLLIETMRSSGAGGQHVNKTDSAVRITHRPSGIVVTCRSERSQHQNKARALYVLRSKLRERYLQERRQRQASMTHHGGSAGFGSADRLVRSYILSPFTLVKDLRTGLTCSDAESVLDGGDALHEMLRAALALDQTDSAGNGAPAHATKR
jgi:peptide chain release factor 2